MREESIEMTPHVTLVMTPSLCTYTARQDSRQYEYKAKLSIKYFHLDLDSGGDDTPEYEGVDVICMSLFARISRNLKTN